MINRNILYDIKYVLEDADFDTLGRFIEMFNNGEMNKDQLIQNVRQLVSGFEKIDYIEAVKRVNNETNLEISLPESPRERREIVVGTSSDELLEKQKDKFDEINKERMLEAKQQERENLIQGLKDGAIRSIVTVGAVVGVVYIVNIIQNFIYKSKRTVHINQVNIIEKESKLFNEYDGLNESASVIPMVIYANTDYVVLDSIKKKKDQEEFYTGIYAGLENCRRDIFKDNKNHPFLRDLKSERIFRESKFMVKRKKNIHKEVHYLLTKKSQITQKEFDSVLTISDDSINRMNEIMEKYNKVF